MRETALCVEFLMVSSGKLLVVSWLVFWGKITYVGWLVGWLEGEEEAKTIVSGVDIECYQQEPSVIAVVVLVG